MQKRIILGENLSTKLKLMDHKISDFILNCADEGEIDIDFSYFNFVKDEGKISFLKKRWEGDGNEFDSSRRETMKIGKLISTLIQKKGVDFSDVIIEEFVNKYKVFQQDEDCKFVLVKGSDISKWYNEDTYEKSTEASSLHNSCMRYKNCKTFFPIYEKSKNVSLLCLVGKKGKLRGRAILWEDISLDGTKVTFLDRIYTYKLSVELAFKDYAIKNGWWFKTRQSTSSTVISNGKKEITEYEMRMYLSPKIDWDKLNKPYMDTMKFFREDIINGKVVEYLSNNGSKNDYKQYWTQTSGGHNVNFSYLSVKDSSEALRSFLNSPVNIIDIKTLECNKNKYRVENMTSIKSFIGEEYSLDKNKFINADNVDDFIDYTNLRILREEENHQVVLNNIQHIRLNNSVINYLDVEQKFKFISDFLHKNKNGLENLKNIKINRVKILPSLRNSIKERDWPELMLELIGNEYKSFSDIDNYSISDTTTGRNWSIPKKDAEEVKIEIDFSLGEDIVIEKYAKLCIDDIISINDIKENICGNYKLGDKVICTNPHSHFYNLEGVVKDIITDSRTSIGVEFKENKGGHNLNGKSKSGYGYYFQKSEICSIHTTIDNDYHKYFNLLSEENKTKYLIKNILDYVSYDEFKKFDTASKLSVVHSDIKQIPYNFDNELILKTIEKFTEYDILSKDEFIFLKIKNS